MDEVLIDRGVYLTGPHADERTRHQIFVLLWALHRLAPLREVMSDALSAQKQVLRFHIGLIISSLADIARLLEEQELQIFRESAASAGGAIGDLAADLGIELDEQIGWSVDFAWFSKETVPTSEDALDTPA